MKKGGKEDPEAFDRLRRSFNESHVKGNHRPDKPYNHQGDFFNPDHRVHSLRLSGAPKGSRVEGTIPGQTSVAVQNVSYRETGYKQSNRDGMSDFRLTGKKDGHRFDPHHLNGQLKRSVWEEQNKTKTRYEDHKGCIFSECSSSVSAGMSAGSSSKNNIKQVSNKVKTEETNNWWSKHFSNKRDKM